MSAENPTVAEMLTAVNAAIYGLLQGKASSYSINGRSYTFHDLDKLRAFRSELQKESESGTGTVMLADISGTSQ